MLFYYSKEAEEGIIIIPEEPIQFYRNVTTRTGSKTENPIQQFNGNWWILT
jgi:hypothetical protein